MTKATSEIQSIVVYDFDGTITTKDTFALFLRYWAGTPQWALKILTLLPTFLAYGIRIIDRNEVKARVIRAFFKDAQIEHVKSRAEKFARTIIPALIRPEAMQSLQNDTKNGETVYICSASITPYLDIWAEDNGIKNVLATELEANTSAYTGSIKGWNLWGAGKTRRIEAEFHPKPVKIARAYGDSRGDFELLHTAEVSYWRPFRV